MSNIRRKFCSGYTADFLKEKVGAGAPQEKVIELMTCWK